MVTCEVAQPVSATACVINSGMDEQIKQLVAQVQLLTKAATSALVIALGTAAATSRPSRVTFVDTRGIGKPATFSSEPRQFPTWFLKLGNFLEFILKGMKDGVERAADQDSLISDLTPLESILEAGTDVKDAGRLTPCWLSCAMVRPWT